MDFYALEMRPRKKDEMEKEHRSGVKRIMEHMVTKDEIFADLKQKSTEHKIIQTKSEGDKATDMAIDTEFSGVMQGIKTILENSKNRLPDGSMLGEEKKETIIDEQAQAQVLQAQLNEQVASNEIREGKITKQPVSEEQIEVVEQPVPEKQMEIIEKPSVENNEEKILNAFVEGMRADDVAKLNAAIEQMIEFRTQDPKRADVSYALNLELKKRLLEGIAALFAYKGAKSIIHVFQLLDELNIEITTQDLQQLPVEILKSEDLKNTCEKYLLWCAREYSTTPQILQAKISHFVASGILSYTEIIGLPQLQREIFNDLLTFVRQNIDSPQEVERKICEYALAGLIDGRGFRNSQKVKMIVKNFIFSMLKKLQNYPEKIEKKIEEFEKTGFVSDKELLADEKIQKAIEKYLEKFKKENVAHQRKINARVKQYYDIGLISKETKERFIAKG